MMNNLIKRELEKVKYAQLPFYDDNTTELLIPKGKLKVDASEDELLVNNQYQIEVEDYILIPSDTFTLHINWNNGVIPTEKIMDVVILQLMGKMVKVASESWEGWLPKKSFKVLKRL